MRVWPATVSASLLAALAACAVLPPGEAPPKSPAERTGTAEPSGRGDEVAIRAAVLGRQRLDPNKKRDVYRHPVETLGFFGLKTDMTVLEMWPGAGWYTEILAPLLADRGKLIVTSVDPNGPQDKPAFKAAHDLEQRFKANRDFFGKVQVARIDPPEHLDLGPDGSVDLVLTFRSTHDWVRDGYADKVYAAMYKVLAPGGTLGVVAHRGRPDADPALAGKTGYLSENYVIKLAEKAGFVLVAKSEVNANPKDVKDYPEGVWTLPPTLRLGEKDREKYLAIGESDRMTLRFVKPAP